MVKPTAHPVHGHSSWSTFNVHLVSGPKALKFVIFGNLTILRLRLQYGYVSYPASTIMLQLNIAECLELLT